MTVRDIRSVEVFGLPMCEIELPEMHAHNDEIIELFSNIIDAGVGADPNVRQCEGTALACTYSRHA